LPESTDPIPTGKIEARYFLSEGTFSGINIQKGDGFSKNVFTIDKDERDDEPDVWDCKFVFYNKSEFPFLLEYIRILSGDVDTEEETVRFDPKVIVPPNSEWESESWDLESEDVPTFGKEVLFTLFPDVDEELKAHIEIRPTELYVLSFKGEKDYSRAELPSYKSVIVTTTNKAWSEGPVDLESFIFEDIVPEDFRPPLPEDLKLFINNDEVDPDRYTVNISPRVNYDADSYPEEHKITIEIENLPDLVEEGSELRARVEYDMNSVQVKPEMEYKTDGLFKAYPAARGPEIDVELIPEPITVTHIRRRETATKSIYPGGSKDEYEIVITYKNRGNSAMAEKVLVDQVPDNFEILKMDPKAETAAHGDVTRLTWTFENIDAGEEVSATYLIKGEGDYKAG
jgi:hypothetical protein